MNPRRRLERNERLWHDAHHVHLPALNVKVLRDGEIVGIGYVEVITNRTFTLKTADGLLQFRFDESSLRIER